MLKGAGFPASGAIPEEGPDEVGQGWCEGRGHLVHIQVDRRSGGGPGIGQVHGGEPTQSPLDRAPFVSALNDPDRYGP